MTVLSKFSDLMRKIRFTKEEREKIAKTRSMLLCQGVVPMSDKQILEISDDLDIDDK